MEAGTVIDVEGHTTYPAPCVCGPVYTYAGTPEPGGFDPWCPVHGNTDYQRAQIIRALTAQPENLKVLVAAIDCAMHHLPTEVQFTMGPGDQIIRLELTTPDPWKDVRQP